MSNLTVGINRTHLKGFGSVFYLCFAHALPQELQEHSS
jgi:hypothetical protein